MTSWTSYFRSFSERYDAIKDDFLKDGAIECLNGPVLKTTEPQWPNSAPFRCDWAVIFGDGKYFRVKETYERLGRPNLGQGERCHFSYHYGIAHKDLDARGFPKTKPIANPPVPDLRIDFEKHKLKQSQDDPYHLHIGSREHISQDRISGFSIQDAEMFVFLEAVRDHRKDGTPLLELLKITVL